jgi:hypothetical protein
MARVSSKVAVLVLALALTLVIATPAFALTNSSTTTQISPGIMQRVIWGQTQVFQYPVQVSHVGNLHVELKFNPNYASNYLNVFIWDGDADVGMFSFENINQGWYTISNGKCVVDYWVPSISDAGQEIVDPDPYSEGDEHLMGDTYTVVVMSYNDWDSRFSIWGYASQTDLTAGYGSSTTSEDNFYLERFKYPAIGTKRLVGVPYGSPWDFKVTSEGTIKTDLQFPADVATKTVTYDRVNAPKPAVWEQYLYAGAAWETVISRYVTPSPQWTPKRYGTAPDYWYGWSDSVDVTETDDFAKPNIMYHYYPDLVLKAGDPAQGGYAPLAEGIQTMGYKATLTYPCNLVLSRAPSSVPMGARATLKGTFALNGAWVAAGTAVHLQFQAARTKTWATKKTVKVGADGVWSGKVKITATGKWRASATGDDLTGLAVELSAVKRIKAK